MVFVKKSNTNKKAENDSGESHYLVMNISYTISLDHYRATNKYFDVRKQMFNVRRLLSMGFRERKTAMS